ncbi:extensin-like [Arachis ipaensis]|uniref:extensin-like n=1 Tax=Arachis ipaensis TaxID=130454 RepID=UPI0007AF743B|nr:extensin-like [Arachis ipaensis]XP_025628173.1 extensin-like [Arachis hypogaea]
MRKKTISQKPPHEKIYKLHAKQKPSTRSQDRTFTPSPSPPTSPPRSDPMARTKNPSRFLPSAKQTPPPKEPPSKPGSSKPSSSKGKCPTATEPSSKPTQPKTRSVPLRSQRDYEFIPEESPPPSTEGTSISTGQKSALFNVVRDVVQEFVSQSNHMISMSKEQRKLASKPENFLRKSRDRVAVFMKFIDNIQQDEDHATDAEEEANSEETGSDA